MRDRKGKAIGVESGMGRKTESHRARRVNGNIQLSEVCVWEYLGNFRELDDVSSGESLQRP